MSGLVDLVVGALPPGSVLSSPDDMAPYLVDWRGMFRGHADCVIRPKTVDEVATVVRLAQRHGTAIVPQGGNTGLAGGATPLPDRPQIVLSLNRMNAVRAVDRAGMTLAVEAGCVVEVAKRAALDAGRQLPIGFAAEGSATIGGMVSTNAGGINALRYGTARQLVLGLEAVLADGTVLHGLRTLRKDVAGYDWKQLLIGSEGTLGIVTAAVLRLAPLCATRTGAFIATDSPVSALSLLEHVQDTLGDSVSAFELMSDASVQRVVRHVGGRVPVEPSAWYVLMEVADNSGDLSARLEAALGTAIEQGIAHDAALSTSLAQLSEFWSLREGMGEAERLAGRSVKHDVSVGVSSVPEFLNSAISAVNAIDPGLDVNAFGHVGDGNIHFNVLGAADSRAEKQINRAVHDVVLQFQGSISAEHGIGQYRVQELAASKSEAEHALMRRIKQALDPAGHLNPGKVLPMT